MRRTACSIVALAAASLAACSTAPAPRGDAGKTGVPASPPAAPAPAPPRDLAAIPDAVPRAEPRSRYGNPASYVVFGRRYSVLDTAKGYVERGTASWYGPGFHAARTSSGEPYDMYAMTAAHKTLPIPAYVRVTNLRNGRSVVVRVNDRGPFVGDRLIDLSYTAAWKLDMLRTGTAPVEVRVLSPDGDLPPARSAAAMVPAPARPAGGPATMLQAGAFFSEANARQLVARLAAAGIGNAVVRSSRAGARTVWQVHVGPFDTAIEVDYMTERLQLAGVAQVRRVLR
ncbi:MAG: septal ring lytic transglycosylase RlpA family protein [Steroidobacteraceae bacterium]|jgi:rare lipoprotein A|nr:septal ring lytic transglycosylase RlpA family protein [Steroidobacteraceae bacterium]